MPGRHSKRLSKAAAARRYNTTPKTVAKWVDRFRKEGADGLHDRSSRPHSSPDQTPQPTCDAVEALRRARYTGKQIAHQLAISPATVSRILRRRGLNKLSALEPAEPLRRYERERPGELVHIDIKKLGRFNQIGHRITGDRRGQSNGRGVGWEYVHVCIDDHSRVAFAKIMSDEKRRSAIAFLKAALAYYASLGIKVERVMTDNGSCYRSFAFRRACKRLGLQPHPHQALHAQDQWQGRALHPDQPARMGLRASLQELPPAKGPATYLAASIQLA